MKESGESNAAADWVRVTFARHGAWHWRSPQGFAFAHAYRQVPVTLDELHACAANMPLAFGGDGMPVAVLRLSPNGLSAFVAPDGGWRGSYVPQMLRLYPFALGAPVHDGAAAALLVDEASGLVGPRGAAGQGVPVFDANGTLSAPVANLRRVLDDRMTAETRTGHAARDLKDAGLLRAFAPDTPLAGGWGIDQGALARLGRTQLARLHRSGALDLAYAHRMSLHHIDVLGRAEAVSAAPPPDRNAPLHAFMAAVSQDMARPDWG
ncbi:SapC family protein [Roseinatronobacter sp.]